MKPMGFLSIYTAFQISAVTDTSDPSRNTTTSRPSAYALIESMRPGTTAVSPKAINEKQIPAKSSLLDTNPVVNMDWLKLLTLKILTTDDHPMTRYAIVMPISWDGMKAP